jgi:tetratricopeptide (TPR) repeat protein
MQNIFLAQNNKATEHSRVANRMRAHAQVKELFLAGRLREAIENANSAIGSFGSHVGLLCDLAACHYELGQYRFCWTVLDRIEGEFAECEALLSTESAWRTLLMMAKLHEERGFLARALECLKKAQDRCEESDALKFLQIQELRILSFHKGSQKELSARYAFVTERMGESENLRLELLHGLMWTENSLFGFEHARLRFERALSLGLSPMERRLWAREFLEICLREEAPREAVNHAIHELQTAMEEADESDLSELDYDRLLLRLAKQETYGVSAAEIFEVSLSPMMTIRILLLCLRTARTSAEKMELHKRLEFLCSSMDSFTREAVQSITPPLQIDRLLEIHLYSSVKDRRARIEQEEFRLTKMQLAFLQCFEADQELTLEELAHRLWKEEWSESLYHRLRMLVYKLNEDLRLSLAQTLFEIGKSGVQMNAGVRIRTASSPR